MTASFIAAITLPALAREVGRDRSTLVRLEQKGVIPEAKWHPVMKCRIYTPADVKAVKAALEVYDASQLGKAGGRMVVDPSTLVVKADR